MAACVSPHLTAPGARGLGQADKTFQAWKLNAIRRGCLLKLRARLRGVICSTTYHARDFRSFIDFYCWLYSLLSTGFFFFHKDQSILAQWANAAAALSPATTRAMKDPPKSTRKSRSLPPPMAKAKLTPTATPSGRYAVYFSLFAFKIHTIMVVDKPTVIQ